MGSGDEPGEGDGDRCEHDDDDQGSQVAVAACGAAALTLGDAGRLGAGGFPVASRGELRLAAEVAAAGAAERLSSGWQAAGRADADVGADEPASALREHV